MGWSGQWWASACWKSKVKPNIWIYPPLKIVVWNFFQSMITIRLVHLTIHNRQLWNCRSLMSIYESWLDLQRDVTTTRNDGTVLASMSVCILSLLQILSLLCFLINYWSWLYKLRAERTARENHWWIHHCARSCYISKLIKLLICEYVFSSIRKACC